jgi:hypothetical protein
MPKIRADSREMRGSSPDLGQPRRKTSNFAVDRRIRPTQQAKHRSDGRSAVARAAGVSFEDRQDLSGHQSQRISTHYSEAGLRI